MDVILGIILGRLLLDGLDMPYAWLVETGIEKTREIQHHGAIYRA